MSLFDLAAGLVLVVSALVGWIRGASREVATVAAIVVAAIVALVALRLTGPIARHAIHTPWLANIAAILVVFVAVYILLRVAASALTRRLHQTSLGGADRAVGGLFGVARALVILGLANLTLGAIVPADRMPAWISGAWLYPVSAVSGRALKAFAPHGVDLAKRVAPVVGHAIATPGDDENRDNNGALSNAADLEAESSP
ncbi:MAG TPA: CvpA family protein [Caulobacteraceae bacterium]|jgi:membrane protein required for colicin V production